MTKSEQSCDLTTPIFTKMAEFDWNGKGGDHFAEGNPTTAEGQDKEYSAIFQAKISNLFTKVLTDLKSNGFDDKKGKILDIGCSSGGKMAIWQSLGINPENLYGLDVTEKGLEIIKEKHPKFQVKLCKGFDYKVFEEDFDFVYHTFVFCVVSPENYQDFFGAIKNLKAKFYMFFEGVNPKGAHKTPRSEAFKIHQEKKSQHQNKDGNLIEHISEGFHYVDDLETIVPKFFPEAKQISRQVVEIQPERKAMINALKMDFFLVSVYKMF